MTIKCNVYIYEVRVLAYGTVLSGAKCKQFFSLFSNQIPCYTFIEKKIHTQICGAYLNCMCSDCVSGLYVCCVQYAELEVLICEKQALNWKTSSQGLGRLWFIGAGQPYTTQSSRKYCSIDRPDQPDCVRAC